MIFRDCHAKNNIVVEANSDREEEKIRLRAMSKGFLVALRKPRDPGQILDKSWTNQTSVHTWRKPAAIIERPRTRLGGAFNLALTQITTEGGAA